MFFQTATFSLPWIGVVECANAVLVEINLASLTDTPSMGHAVWCWRGSRLFWVIETTSANPACHCAQPMKNPVVASPFAPCIFARGCFCQAFGPQMGKAPERGNRALACPHAPWTEAMSRHQPDSPWQAGQVQQRYKILNPSRYEKCVGEREFRETPASAEHPKINLRGLEGALTRVEQTPLLLLQD